MTESRSIFSQHQSFSSLLFKASSHSRRLRRTSISTTFYSPEKLNTTGKRLEAILYPQSSRTLFSNASAMTANIGQPSMKSENTHG